MRESDVLQLVFALQRECVHLYDKSRLDLRSVHT